MRIVRPGMVVGPQQQYMMQNQMKWVTWVSWREVTLVLWLTPRLQLIRQREWAQTTDRVRVTALPPRLQNLTRRLCRLLRLQMLSITAHSSLTNSPPSYNRRRLANCFNEKTALCSAKSLFRLRVAMLLDNLGRAMRDRLKTDPTLKKVQYRR